MTYDSGLHDFIVDYYWHEKPKRIIWKGKDFTEKSAKIEQRKLGCEWKTELSPYEKGRFIITRDEPKLPLDEFIKEYKSDLEIIYKQQQKRCKI